MKCVQINLALGSIRGKLHDITRFSCNFKINSNCFRVFPSSLQNVPLEAKTFTSKND